MKYFFDPTTTCHLCAKGHKDSRNVQKLLIFLRAIPVPATCSSPLVVWLLAASAFQGWVVRTSVCLVLCASEKLSVSREIKMSTERREEGKELKSIIVYPTNNVLETKPRKPQICAASKANAWLFYLKNGGSLNTCEILQKEIFSQCSGEYLLQSMYVTCVSQWRFVSV